MRAAVYYNNDDIRIKNIPVPKINKGEILVKVKASGICGTDVMEWYRVKKGPRILGHEIAGDITESRSDKYKPGQRVFVSHHVPCDKCKYCGDGNQTACDTLHNGNYDPGGYSEFVRVPALNAEKGVYILPDNVSYESATMIEPLACAVRAQRVIGINKSYTVAVLGCGIAGLTNIVIAKLKGAKVIATDVNEYRLNKAREFQADEIINAGKDFSLKAERVIICTGADKAVEQSFKIIDKSGKILFFAIPRDDIKIPTVNFWRNELTVTSSYGASPVDIEEALSLISKGMVDAEKMITHKVPFENISEAFRIVASAKDSLKVVLNI